MGRIELKSLINAPIDRCFDLSLSVDFHMQSAAGTQEKAIAGVTKGMMGYQDVVTWRAKHFGIVQTLSTKIVSFERPKYFRDSQVQGIFKRFDHDHFFESVGDKTLMKDIFDFTCPLGILGSIVDVIVKEHLQMFLEARNKEIKRVAESDEWQQYIKPIKS